MVWIEGALGHRTSFAVIGDIGNVVEFPERNRHREDAVAEVVPDEDVERSLVHVSHVRQDVERVQFLGGVQRGGQFALFGIHFQFLSRLRSPGRCLSFAGHIGLG